MTAAVTYTASGVWTFHLHPEVWLLVAGLAALYVYAIRVIGPKVVPDGWRDSPISAAVTT